jgi:hypothetical protein
MKQFRFEHSFVDADLGFDGIGAVVVADFDGDGRPEFATGGKGGGFYYIYDYDPSANVWTHQVVTTAISPNVGATAVDMDGDGRPELVCGEWGDRLHWIRPVDGDWRVHTVGRGLDDPHDILAGDLDGDGREEVVVREKDGRLMIWQAPDNPEHEWVCQVLAESLPGDGTSLVQSDDRMDIVTNVGWFENVEGDGSRWERRSLVPSSLDWHPESRLAVADVDGDGKLEVVITESEIGPARLALLRPDGPGKPWDAEVILDRDLDLRALHSLQVVDLDGDGVLEIFTAEMENGKTDGVDSVPKWFCLSPRQGGGWDRHVLLDENIGTHSAVAADFDGDGRVDLVGKVWRANPENGAGGRNHVDFLRNLGSGS